MKKNHILVMVLSALSAGLLVSCVKTTDDNQTADGDGQEIVQNVDASSNESNSTQQAITPIAISAATQKAYLTHVADNIVIPAYVDAAKQSEALHLLADQYCKQTAVRGDELQALRDQWLVLAQAWARAEMINFGPATASMSNLYINYYPDERGLVKSGVAELIAANPALTAEQLADESAIVQGVPGLEEALFANDSLDAAQCAYVSSASFALSNRLKAIESNWQDHASELLAIDQSNNKEGLNQWINALLSLVEVMKTDAIDQPLGLNANAKGHLPAATAGFSRSIINAKLAVLNETLTDPVLTAMLNTNGESTIGNELSTVLAQTTTLLAQMPEDLARADRSDQQALFDNMTAITRLIKRQLIPTLGLQVGFNSNDGD